MHEAMKELATKVAESIFRDAERYRWLRAVNEKGMAVFEMDGGGEPNPLGVLVGGHLDEAVDAAMHKEEK